ncbi:hypothetical protein V8F20_010399 [Naviculisporaceae sp. PSN 640]
MGTDGGSPPLNETASTPTLLPGQSPPLTVVTATDQTGVVIIGAILALVFSVISMFIRLFIRSKFQNEFAKDDTAAFVALGLFVIQSGLLFGQVSFGFGKTMEDISGTGLVELQRIGYVSDIFAFFTLWATKCSIAFLFIRLSPDRTHILLARICLGVSTFVMMLSILITSLRCDLARPWIFIGEQCPGLISRWQVVVALDIFTEVSLFAVALFLTLGLQLSVSKKIVVLLAFGLRVPVIAPAILRLTYLDSFFFGPDPPLDGVTASLCMQIQISYAIIAMTTPCLRPFMSALNTHYGGPKETRTPGGTKASRTAKSDNSYSLSSLPRSKVERTEATPEHRHDPEAAPVTRWDRADYRVAVMSRNSRNLSIDGGSTQSNDSQRMIISKNTEWQVEFGEESLREGHTQRPADLEEIGVAKG